MDFSGILVYNIVEIGGVVVNEFEQDVNCKRNDVIDSGMGFVVSFVFFTVVFVVGTVIELLGR